MKLFKAMLCSVAALSLLLPAAHAQAAPTVVKIALTQPTGPVFGASSCNEEETAITSCTKGTSR